MELIAEVDTLAQNEEYISLLSASSELNESIVKIASEDYSTPKAVFAIEDLGKIFIDTMLSAGEISLSDDVKEIVEEKLIQAIPSQINAVGGAENTVVASLLAHNDSFIYYGLDVTTTYLYTFDSNYCFMVAFVPNDENIINANVTVVINEELAKAETIEEVNNALGFGGLSIVYNIKDERIFKIMSELKELYCEESSSL